MILEVISKIDGNGGGYDHDKDHLFILVFARVQASPAVAVSTTGHLHHSSWSGELSLKTN